MVFKISSPFLPIFVTSFSIGTEKFIYFSLFSHKQVNCPLNYFARFQMVSW